MKNRKRTGSFYTPKTLADFLVDYLAAKLYVQEDISVLEPSAGDGIFIRSIYANDALSAKVKKVVAVEKNKRELNKIVQTVKNKSFSPIHADFLEFQNQKKQRFSLTIGNPPYIRKNFLKEKQLRFCKAIHRRAQLADTEPKNIWTAFLVRCINFTANDGILAFVLPAELLQVKFAAELRDLIQREFERVEIFTFNELLFKDCKGQDTLVLIGERKSKNKGVFYCNIDKLKDLEKRNFTLSQNAKVKESKWTHHHLETEEIELLEKLRGKLKTVNDYCSSKAGIVTAANDYFIVDENTVEEFSLHDFVRPIIQKGIFVNGSVELSKKDFRTLVKNHKPTYLLSLDKSVHVTKYKSLGKYLRMGKVKSLDIRYKMTFRHKWYRVPNIGIPAEAFFFKRCNEYPKLIKNTAGVLATDSAYTIAMKDNFKIENLIYSFYNSLTLAFAELHGRFYGGGVLELTPNEFKELPVPYVDLKIKSFNSYVSSFKNKSSIKEICRQNDKQILKSVDKNLDDESIASLQRIREKLFLRRIKKK
jgi:adenine-specific DNA-methyltransferase